MSIAKENTPYIIVKMSTELHSTDCTSEESNMITEIDHQQKVDSSEPQNNEGISIALAQASQNDKAEFQLRDEEHDESENLEQIVETVTSDESNTEPECSTVEINDSSTNDEVVKDAKCEENISTSTENIHPLNVEETVVENSTAEKSDDIDIVDSEKQEKETQSHEQTRSLEAAGSEKSIISDIQISLVDSILGKCQFENDKMISIKQTNDLKRFINETLSDVSIFLCIDSGVCKLL